MCNISSPHLLPVDSYKRLDTNTKPQKHKQCIAVPSNCVWNSKSSNRKLILTLILFSHLSFTTSTPASTPIISEIHNHVPTGAVIHLFPRYGYLSLSMRVVPRNDSQPNWVFLEPARDIFLGSTLQIEERSFSSTDSTLPIHNEFHIDLCEDINQLVQAYYRRFYIQGLDKPWQAFSGGWRTPSLSKHFGIDPTFVVGDYRYMLVRVLMVRNSGKVIPFSNITVNAEFQGKVDNFGEHVSRSMYHFANDVGTHYVHSYISGNALYQVFVYDVLGFDAVKHRLSEFNRQQPNYISQLPSLLPLWSKQIGKLFILNSSPQGSEKVHHLMMLETFRNIIIPNIFKLHDNPTLVREVELLLKNEPNGLLGIELRTIDIIFKDMAKKQWFVQSLKHLLELWQANFQ